MSTDRKDMPAQEKKAALQSSEQLFRKAKKLIPGGVNSPVRACKNVGMHPLFIASASGASITSVDGDTYVDCVMSWGPMLLGHSHPAVNAALKAAVPHGTSYGAPCPAEIGLAERILAALPGMEMVRMVNSGTEATMSALRLARAVTGRNKIIKFTGNYHGFSDPLMASAGSGVATLSIPGTPGVPDSTVRDTLLAPYNDLAAVRELFVLHKDDLAAVIVEPVAANMGVVLPKDGFLKGLRELTANAGALLIFDEVITGFRLAYGGAQTRFGIEPDITTLGKIIGGGLPVGAYAGKAQYMKRVAPSGDVYQAGTLAGNPLAMAAGIATLDELKKQDYAALEQRVGVLADEIQNILQGKGVSVQVARIASMLTVFFTAETPTCFDGAIACDAKRYTQFYQQMREQGVYLAPSAYEAAMFSFAHTERDFAKIVKAVKNVTFF